VLVVVVAVCVLAGCISPVIPIGGGKSAKQNQHEVLNRQAPAQLSTQGSYRGEPRAAKLRVWADAEYRAQNVRWQHAFEEQLDGANQVLLPMLGIRLEPDYRAWDRQAPGGTLEDALDALVAADPGDDVVWVVGLTSSLSLVTPTFEELGLAHLAGRHVVVRGHADLEERKAYERAFPSLDLEEREAVLEARRRHKTTTVLLHELAHSLGALHELDPESVMNATYSHLASTISDRDRDLMQIVLEDRLKPPAERDTRATAQRLLALLEVEWPGWPANERAQAVMVLRGHLGAAAPAGIAGILPPAAGDDVHRAEDQLAAGRPTDALAILEPLIAVYPAHAALRVLACKAEIARGGIKSAKATTTCDRAAGMSASIEPAIEIAALRLAAGDARAAGATLVSSEPRIAELPPDKAKAAWLALAARYRELGAITWAEAAVAKAGVTGDGDAGISAWAATTRVRYGVPRDGARWKLTPPDEPAALAAVQGVLSRINTNKFDAAVKEASAAETRWPALPGLLAARCDLELRRGAAGAARQYCDRAIAQGGSSWALYLRGVLELQGTSQAATAAGIARLRAAIELDPQLAQAWRTLGKALARIGATAELDKLAADYRARFNMTLPR